MATKVAVRYVSRRFSSGAPRRFSSGAHKGQKAEDTSASSGGADAKASDSTALTISTAGVSTDKNRNFAVVAGVMTGLAVVTGVAAGVAVVAGVVTSLGALGWYKYRVHQFQEETLSTVIENNKGSGMFCSYVRVGHDGITIRWE